MTDQALNEAMARALGYRILPNRMALQLMNEADSDRCGYMDKDGTAIVRVFDGNGRCTTERLDFCNDRNRLPEIWAVVESAGRLHSWTMAMSELTGCNWRDEYVMMKQIPRLHAIAALRALGQYPEPPAATENADRAAEEMDTGQEP